MNERRAQLDGNRIKITFPYNPTDVARVRTLPKRKFNGSAKPKHWTCAPSPRAITQLREWGFTIDDDLLSLWAEEIENEYEAEQRAEQVETILHIPGMKADAKPLPFQGEGVAFLERRMGRALLADEMGLGKTFQAIAYLALHPELRPAVVVCPASLKYNWELEIHKFMKDPDVEVLSGKKPYEPKADLLIINWDILGLGPKDGPTWAEVLKGLNPKIVIADEAHYAKENKTKRTKALKDLAKGRKFIALTGTPVINRPVEFFNILHMVDPDLFPSFWKFTQRYCDAKHNGYGWDFTGSSNEEELHNILTSTVMIRRLKKDVMKDLPPKRYSMIPLEMSAKGRKAYDAAYEEALGRFFERLREKKHKMCLDGCSEAEIKSAMRKAKTAKAMVRIEALKQAAAQGKIEAAIRWVQDHLDSNGKLVLFATHKEIIQRVMEAFPNISVKVDGDTPATQRQEAVLRFQEDPECRLFVGNIKAAGVGLTLTAASSVAFLEFPWTPGELVQAEDRCHRIGQRDSVNVYYLLAHDTIDRQIAELLDRKREVISAVVDGVRPDEGTLLAELMEEVFEDAA